MEWSLFQDSEETIHSAAKKLPHMKAFSLCIDKKQKNFSSSANSQFSSKNIENWRSWKMTFCLVFSFWLLGFSIFFINAKTKGFHMR